MQEFTVVTDSARGYSVSTTIIPAVANEHTNSSYSTNTAQLSAPLLTATEE